MRKRVVKEFSEAILPDKDFYYLGPCVRVRGSEHIHRPHKDREDCFLANSWVCIEANEHKIYRLIRGGSAKGLKNHTIMLDYDGMCALEVPDFNSDKAIDTGKMDEDGRNIKVVPFHVTIRSISWFEQIFGYFSHSDRDIRASMQLAIIALITTMLGLAISIISLSITLLSI